MRTKQETAFYPPAVWVPLLLLAVLVPLAMNNGSVLGIASFTADTFRGIKILVFAALALISASSWALTIAKRRSVIRWDSTFGLLAAVIGTVVISTITSAHLPTAVFGSYEYRQGLVTMLVLGILAFLVMQVSGLSVLPRQLAAASVVGGVLVAAYGLIQVAGLDPASWGDEWMLARGFSTIGNPDLLGGYLILPGTLALGLALSEERRGTRLVWWATFAALAVGLLLTQVRGAWLGMLVSGVIMLVFVHRSRTRLTRLDFVAAGLALLLLIGGGIAAREGIVDRVTDMFSGERDAGSGRIVLWQTGVRAISGYPLAGVGPDSFRYGFYEMQSTEHDVMGGHRNIAGDAHNLMVMLGATLGLPALVLAIAFFGVLMVRSGTVAFQLNAGPEQAVYAAWLAAFVGHLVYLLFGPSSISSNVVMAIAAGVLLGAHARTIEKPSRIAALSVAVGLAAVCTISLVSASMTFVGDHYYHRSISGEDTEALSFADKAVAVSPWTYEYRARRAELLAEAADEEWGSGAVQSPALMAAIEEYEELIAFAPREYLTYVYYTRFLLSRTGLDQDGYEQALEVARRGVDIAPSGLEVRTLGAFSYLRLGRPEGARQMLEFDWDSDSAYAESGVMYASALLSLGRLDEASAVIDVLATRFSENTEVADLEGQLRKARAGE